MTKPKAKEREESWVVKDSAVRIKGLIRTLGIDRSMKHERIEPTVRSRERRFRFRQNGDYGDFKVSNAERRRIFFEEGEVL